MMESPGESSFVKANGWQSFWFLSDANACSLRYIRIGLAIVSTWYFLSHWTDAGVWFADSGILSTSHVAGFLETGDLTDTSQWRLSPLFLTDSLLIVRGYLIVGVCLAVACVWFQSSRAVAICLWLMVLWLANRSLLIDGPEELAIVFGLTYMAIYSPAHEISWQSALARRLIQVHTSLLIGISGLAMLSSLTWWDGTGAFGIAAPVGRRLVDLTTLLTSPGIHEPLTHAIVFTAVLGSIALWIPRLTKPAWIALTAWCVVVSLLSSQWMYLGTIAILLQSFRRCGDTPSASIDG